MKCVGPSQISNIVFSFAERFNWELLGVFHTSSFLNSLTEHGFTLTLSFLFLLDYILFCISPKVWRDLPSPQLNSPCSWANRALAQYQGHDRLDKRGEQIRNGVSCTSSYFYLCGGLHSDVSQFLSPDPGPKRA